MCKVLKAQSTQKVFSKRGMVSRAVLVEDWTLVVNGGRLFSGARLWMAHLVLVRTLQIIKK